MTFEDFGYERTDLEVKITFYQGSVNFVNIPEQIDRLPVTAIGNDAFSGSLFSGCSSLTSVTIPNSVTSIGDFAFSDCRSLKSIVISDFVTTIYPYAFNWCISLTSVIIPNSVVAIGYSAFKDCKTLKSVAIPASLTHIGKDIFENCHSLTTIYFPSSLKNSLQSFCQEYENKIHYYNFPSNFFAKIGRLQNAYNLHDDTLTEVKQIETLLHSNKYNSSINTKINKILDDFIAIQELQRKIDTNPVVNLITLLEEISERKIENAPKYINKLNNEIAEIEARIKTGIEALSPPKVVKKKRFKFCPECGIGNVSNRKKCTGCGHDISDIIPITEFEYDVQNISYGEDFEYESDGFEVKITKYKGPSDSMNIPPRIDGLPVTSIGDMTFYDCSSLESITIPKSVTSIGDSIFARCNSLTTIHFPNSLRNVKGDDNTLERFRNEYKDKIRYYKTDTKTARVMEVPDFWKNNFAESQTEPKSNFKYSRTESGIYIDKYIGHNAIVSIPEAIENLPVKSIGYRAFDNENLYKVIILASVNTIVYSAFVSRQPMHVLFKGDSIQIIPQSFIAPQITFYYTNNAIAGILYGIADNNPKYIVNYNAANFDKV